MVDEGRREFHHEVRAIHDDVTDVLRRLIDAIPRATEILLGGNLTEADEMIGHRGEFYAMTHNLEERCVRVLALQGPMASDFRRIVGALKITPEIERSSDLLVNICKAARRLYGHGIDGHLSELISRMSDQAAVLFSAAADAYANDDEALASAVDDMDRLLDGLQKQFVSAIFECHADSRIDVTVAIQLALVARFYERVGDHAVNIAQRVPYILGGRIPEHTSKTRAVQT